MLNKVRDEKTEKYALTKEKLCFSWFSDICFVTLENNAITVKRSSLLKKRKKCPFYKEKGLVRLTPGVNPTKLFSS